jgi:hypothetical protein
MRQRVRSRAVFFFFFLLSLSSGGRLGGSALCLLMRFLSPSRRVTIGLAHSRQGETRPPLTSPNGGVWLGGWEPPSQHLPPSPRLSAHAAPVRGDMRSFSLSYLVRILLIRQGAWGGHPARHRVAAGCQRRAGERGQRRCAARASRHAATAAGSPGCSGGGRPAGGGGLHGNVCELPGRALSTCVAPRALGVCAVTSLFSQASVTPLKREKEKNRVHQCRPPAPPQAGASPSAPSAPAP